MKLKRILAVLLVICLMLPMVACGDKDNDTKVTTTVAGDTGSTTVDQGVEGDTTTDVTEEGETTDVTEEGETTDVTEEGETTGVTEEGETTGATQANGTTSQQANVPGQNTTTKNGLVIIPGQTTTTTKQQVVIPGQTMTTTKQQVVVPGQTTTTTKQQVVVPGQTTTTTKAQQVQQNTTTTRTKKSKFQVSTQTVKVDGPSTLGTITVKEGTKPVEQGLNFGGKEFSFAYYGSSWDADHTAWHNDFQKQYNVKLKIKGLPTDEYAASLASAMAAGTPYDIVYLYNFDYPSQITANTMAPLNDYVTTADLWKEGSDKTGGFSYALMEALSLNGNIYCVAGTYLQAPTVVWYNKKLFKAAGYDDKDDPYALYKAGKWTWQALYDMLLDIQDPSKGLYGINTIAPYYDHQFINSFGTDFAKVTDTGDMVQNLKDPQLYKAYEMLQKMCYGEQKVVNPKDQFESGRDQFLNGTTASLVATAGTYWTVYKYMVEQGKHYSAFGSKSEQLDNLGVVPLPNDNPTKVHSIWDWMGYGAGNGATEEGILCALAFAKHDSINNHKDAYHPNMPSWMKNMLCGVLDSDNLIAPKNGFKTSAGSLGGISTSISQAIAMNGQNITVVLKGYEKQAQVVIDTALGKKK